MLGATPEGHHQRSQAVLSMRMVVRDYQPALAHQPVGRARVALAPRVSLQHDALYVCPRHAEQLSLDEGMIGPLHQAGAFVGHFR